MIKFLWVTKRQTGIWRDNDMHIRVANMRDILVADVDGTVVGFSHVMILKQKNIACLKPQTAVYIQDLDVLESERNKGIGTLLIKGSKEYGKMKRGRFY